MGTSAMKLHWLDAMATDPGDTMEEVCGQDHTGNEWGNGDAHKEAISHFRYSKVGAHTVPD